MAKVRAWEQCVSAITIPTTSETPIQETPPTGHATLEQLYSTGDHCAVINEALKRLSTDPGEICAAFLAFRSYVALGLVGPALELLNENHELQVLAPELQEVRKQLTSLPDGRIAWQNLQNRFECNLRQLLQARPEWGRYESAWRAVPKDWEFFRTLQGEYQLSAGGIASQRRWLSDLFSVSRIATQAPLAHDSKNLFCAPYVIVGDRFNAWLQRVYAGTRKMFLTFTPRIYLVEEDPRMLGAALHVLDSIDELCDERVDLLLGSDCVEQLAKLLEDNTSRSIPDFVVQPPPANPDLRERIIQTIRGVVDRRTEQAKQTIAKVKSAYDSLPIDHWQRRYTDGGSTPLRVFGLTSRFTTVLQHSMRDLQAAFERQGHRFCLLIEDNDHDSLPRVKIAEAFAAFQPDLVFIIDHLRKEYSGLIPTNVPYLCWIQDQLPNLIRPEAGKAQGPLDFYIAPDLEPLIRKFHYPPQQGFMWTMATNEQLYSAEPLSAEELAPYRCDFSYVSNVSQVPQQYHEQRQRELGGGREIARLTDCLFAILRQHLAGNPESVCGTAMTFIHRAVRESGVQLATPEAEDRLGRFYFQPLAELMFRQQALEWAADYCDQTGHTLHLYGNGWENHPRFARYARGVAQNGRELRTIYQASAVNLQINTYGAIHQRLLDGLAAGGFFMIRRCPTDGIQAALTEFLSVVGECGIEADRVYRRDDSPRLAAALDRLADQYGEPRQAAEITLPHWRLEYYRNLAAKDFMRVAGAVFGDYEPIAFGCYEEFARKAANYLVAEEQRRTIATSMRQETLRRFTYDALVNELIRFIRDKLGCGSAR